MLQSAKTLIKMFHLRKCGVVGTGGEIGTLLFLSYIYCYVAEFRAFSYGNEVVMYKSGGERERKMGGW